MSNSRGSGVADSVSRALGNKNKLTDVGSAVWASSFENDTLFEDHTCQYRAEYPYRYRYKIQRPFYLNPLQPELSFPALYVVEVPASLVEHG